MYRLEQNYRSTRISVNAANSIIAIETNQLKKRWYGLPIDEGPFDQGASVGRTNDAEEGTALVSGTIFEEKKNAKTNAQW